MVAVVSTFLLAVCCPCLHWNAYLADATSFLLHGAVFKAIAMASAKVRPSPLSTKSFTRYEPPASPASSTRSRASTIASPELSRKSLEEERQDVFNRKREEEEESTSANIDKAESLPDHFDELPVELASLTDRYAQRTTAWRVKLTIEQIY